MWIDAVGNPTGPASMKYEYDLAGNLTHSRQLVDETDPTNAVYVTTEYKYENAAFPHYITEIVDPRGIPAMRTEYDDDGRIIATVDAAGNRIELDHDIGSRIEIIRDRLGNPTVHSYDLRGNVVATTDALGHTTTRTYDEDDNETSITDPLGHTTSFTYDGAGNQTSMTDPLTNATVFTYDLFGNQLTVTDPLGFATTNEYDADGNLTATIDTLGNRTENTFNSKGQLAAFKDALGNTVASLAYDIAGNLSAFTDALGVRRGFTYDARGNQNGTQFSWVNPLDTNDVRLVATTTEYDGNNRVVRTVDPDGNESRTVYNDAGQVIETVDALSNTTITVYDHRGHRIETQFPEGTVSRTVYDANGRPVVTVDRHIPGEAANGIRTVYDPAGRVIRTERLSDVVVNIATNIDPVSSFEFQVSEFVSAGSIISSNSTTYDPANRVVATTDEAGETTTFEYDDAGRQTAVVDALTNRTEFVYDAAGRNALTRDALGRETQFEYDALGRVTRTTFDDGTFTETGYDVLGRRVAETDQTGKTRNFEYDVQGRLTAVVLPAVPDPEDPVNPVKNPRYEYEYDIYANLRTIRDPKGRETYFEFDERNRQTARILPLGQRETQEYDALGRLARQTDFMGQVMDMVYDSLGRRSEKHLYAATNTPPAFIDVVPVGGAGSPDELIQFIYDALGRQDQIVEARGTTTHAYDLDSRLTQVASPEGTVNYAYDAATSRRTRTFTDYTETSYTYDELGRLKTASAVKRMGQVLATPDVTTYNYTAIGSRESQVLPNGVTTTYQYDDLNRLTQLAHANSVGDLLGSYGYIVREDGRRTALTELQAASPDYTPATNAIAYTYDGLNRLTRETATNPNNGAGHDTTYVYDLVGNRLERTIVANGQILRTVYEYNDNDQLISEVNTTELAGIPLRTDDDRYPAGVYFVPKPTKWSWYAFWTLAVVVFSAFLLPLWPLRPLASPGAGGSDHPRRSRLPMWMRSTACGLAALMALSGPMYETLAQDADLYAQLSTDDWRQDGETVTYEYDDNGSLIRETHRIAGDITRDKTYAYNLENRLSVATITYPGSPEIINELSYAYNQDGIRVSKTEVVTADAIVESGKTTLYLVDALNHTGYAQVLEELPSVGAVPTRSYTIGDDVLSQVDQTSSFEFQVSHFLYDGHGSTRQLTDDTGAPTARYGFDAYGIILGGNPGSAAVHSLGVDDRGPAATDMLYSGEQFDAALGKQYLRARYYDKDNGRFTRVDPFSGDNGDPQSLHKYTYVHADPVNGVDPTGMATLLETLIGLAGIAVLTIGIVVAGLSVVRRLQTTGIVKEGVGELLGRFSTELEAVGRARLDSTGETWAVDPSRTRMQRAVVVGQVAEISVVSGSGGDAIVVRVSQFVENLRVSTTEVSERAAALKAQGIAENSISARKTLKTAAGLNAVSLMSDVPSVGEAQRLAEKVVETYIDYAVDPQVGTRAELAGAFAAYFRLIPDLYGGVTSKAIESAILGWEHENGEALK